VSPDPIQSLAGPTSDARSRVLIVDDSADVHRLLRARLKHDELELDSAFSEDEGFERAIAMLPDLILLDIGLPTDEGLRLLRRLKDEPRTRDVPVVILSGFQSPQVKVAAFDLGAVDYVTKPFDLTELRVRMRAALRTYELLQMLSKRAQIDGLTGLWNRAFFDKRMAEELTRAQRYGHPLSLAMVDLDYFKQVNDTYGHPVGDAVLQGVARVLRRETRESDLVCRFGGEEFAVVMPETNPQDALKLSERIRIAVGETRWPRVPQLHVTVSMGVIGATAPGVLPNPEDWIELCDRQLYAAKHNGRNRIAHAFVPDSRPGELKAAG
jgi:two-component system, cell cycle response regulator